MGGSGSAQEIGRAVVGQMRLPDDVVMLRHGAGPDSELEYRLAWARTILKAYGLITRSGPDCWALTQQCAPESSIEPEEIEQFYAGSGGSLENDLPESMPADVAEALEDDLWQRFASEQFLAGYSKADAVYDEA